MIITLMFDHNYYTHAIIFMLDIFYFTFYIKIYSTMINYRIIFLFMTNYKIIPLFLVMGYNLVI